MKKQFAILIIFFFSTAVFSQNITQIDSVTVAMCHSLEGMPIGDDNTKINTLFQKHLPDFYKELGVFTQSKADSIADKIYYRLQRNCNLFREILDRLEVNKSDWEILKEKPITKISKKDCTNFLNESVFYYKEYNGSIVNVLIKGNVWQETFEDGTFSKLVFISKMDGEFDLEFLESNNEMRKNFSVKGDIYNYGIFTKNESSYRIWVKSKDNSFASFKLYSKK